MFFACPRSIFFFAFAQKSFLISVTSLVLFSSHGQPFFLFFLPSRKCRWIDFRWCETRTTFFIIVATRLDFLYKGGLLGLIALIRT